MVDAGQQAGHRRRGPPDGVAPDEGVQGGLHKPLPQPGQVVHRVHRPPLGVHQVPAVAGQQAHQHHADVHILLPEDGVQTGRLKDLIIRIWLGMGE